MADEPDNVVLRLLREIHAAQQGQGETLAEHSSALARLEKRAEDLYEMTTHALGVAVTGHERYESLEAPVDRLSEQVRRLEAKQ
jgi:archaellum component FlaC